MLFLQTSTPPTSSPLSPHPQYRRCREAGESKLRKATARVPTHPHHPPPPLLRTAWGAASFVVIVEAGDEGRPGGDPCGRLSRHTHHFRDSMTPSNYFRDFTAPPNHLAYPYHTSAT